MFWRNKKSFDIVTTYHFYPTIPAQDKGKRDLQDKDLENGIQRFHLKERCQGTLI